MKSLNEIRYGHRSGYYKEQEMIKAPEIAIATMLGKTIYVKDKQGNILFILTADQLLGYTATTITVRLGSYSQTYNNMGSQINLQTLR